MSKFPWKTRAARWCGVLSMAAALAACGGGGGDGPGANDGSLRMALTDAPACGYDHVWVTIEKVSVHQSASAADADLGWKDLTLSPARKVDLLSLTNGVLEELGTMPLPSGQYSQIRLVLASNTGTGASALANSIQPTNGAVTALSTPSAQQSGLKLQAHFDVAAGQMADVVLDFDACKSIVRAGNSGKYNLKPVIAVVPRIASGIQGYVSTSMPLGSTTVAAQQGSVTIRATTPDATGKFSIPYLGAGAYTLVIASEGRATAVITGVTAGTATTVINGTATAIATPVSQMADVTGSVVVNTVSGSATVGTPLTDAVVRATQALSGGPVIELGVQPVDATAATYAFHLPVAAPQKVAYTSSGALVFTADTTAAGKYVIQSQAPGRAGIDKPADISAGSSVIANLAYGP